MMSQTMTTRISIGRSGDPPVVTINNFTFGTAPRLSGLGSLPLMSRLTISPVSRSLNETVVSCFEGTTSTESVATTTIYIIGGEEYNVNTISYSLCSLCMNISLTICGALYTIAWVVFRQRK